MKKITRLFMALALCGAAFVYTSCTDFTEDIKSVNTRVDNLDKQHSADIKSLQDQAASLQTQITALQTAKEAAEKNITLLQSQVKALEAFQETATKDIASIKTQHEVDFKNLTADIKAANDEIDALQEFQKKAEAQIKALQEADVVLQKNIDGKVDTAVFNAAIKKAYEDFAKLADFNDLKSQYLTLTANSTMTIAQIEAAIKAVADNLAQAKIDLKALIDTNAGKIAANRKSIDSLCLVVANNVDVINNELKPDVAKAKEDIIAINETLPTLAKTAQVKTWLQSLYTVLDSRIEADSLALVATNENVDSLCDEVTALKANKVEVSVYNTKMQEVDQALADQLAAIEDLDSRVYADSLVTDELVKWVVKYEPVITKLVADVTTLSEQVATYMGKVDALEDAFVNRIQSLVFVPEYDDLCAQAYDYVLGARNQFADAPQTQDAEVVEGNESIASWLTDILTRLWKIHHPDPVVPTEPEPNILNIPQYLCTGWNNVLESEDESTDWSLGYNVVYGTFQVYPANLAEDLKAQFEAGNVGMLMQFVGLEASRVANDFIPSEDLEVISADNTTGYLYVRARFETTKITEDGVPTVEEHYNFVDKPAAISLYIFDNAEAVEEAEGEGEVVVADLGRYICSHYVPVNVSEIDLAGDYVLAGVEDHKEYPTRKYTPVHNLPLPSFFNIHEISAFSFYGQSIEKPWDLVNSPEKEDYVDFQNGYEPQMVVEKEIMSLQDAADYYFLPVECVTPNLNLSYDYTDYYETLKPETKAGNIAGEFAVDTDKAAVEMKDTTKAGVAIDWVEDQATAMSWWTLNTVPVLLAYDTYTIGWREIKLHHALADQNNLTVYPWTYQFALAHADSQTAPTTENVQPNQTKEVVATCTNKTKEQGFGEINFEELLKQTPVSKVYQTGDPTAVLEGWAVKAENGTSDPEALTFTADVSTTGYSFDTENLTDVTAELQYKDEETKSRVVVTYDFEYGYHPDDLQFEFTKDDFYYEPKVTYLSVDSFALANAISLEQAYASYFADNAEFLGSFKDSDVTTDSKVYTGEDIKVASEWSYISLSKKPSVGLVDTVKDSVYVRLSQADVYTYQDTYKFTKNFETWYGVNYNFIVNVELVQPFFKLAFWPNKVTEKEVDPELAKLFPSPYALLQGKYENTVEKVLDGTQGDYVVDKDNLSRYYRIVHTVGDIPYGEELISEAERGLLTIKYRINTKEDEAKGFKNVPAWDAAKAYAVNSTDFTIENANLYWNGYTARQLNTTAGLYCNNVLVNELTLNLCINDPVTTFQTLKPEIKVKRVPNKPQYAYFWQNLSIRGILNPDKELIDQAFNQTSIAPNAYLYNNPYKLDVTFDFAKQPIMYIGKYEDGINAWTPYELSAQQVEWNAEKGYIKYNDDDSFMQQDVIIPVKLNLAHVYNYLNNPEYEKESHIGVVQFYVVFTEKDPATPTDVEE